MKYRLTVTRIDPHPKAGERVEPTTHYGQGFPERYPETLETQALVVVLSDEEYSAVKKACIGAAA